MFWFCKDRFIFILKSICIYIPQSNISLYSSMEVGTPAEGKQFGNESKKKNQENWKDAATGSSTEWKFCVDWP